MKSKQKTAILIDMERMVCKYRNYNDLIDYTRYYESRINPVNVLLRISGQTGNTEKK